MAKLFRSASLPAISNHSETEDFRIDEPSFGYLSEKFYSIYKLYNITYIHGQSHDKNDRFGVKKLVHAPSPSYKNFVQNLHKIYKGHPMCEVNSLDNIYHKYTENERAIIDKPIDKPLLENASISPSGCTVAAGITMDSRNIGYFGLFRTTEKSSNSKISE